MKLCILFPGIGYHCDKPLLYYSAKLARSKGYEVIALKYGGFPQGAKGNDEKMRSAAEHALIQSEQQLAGVDLSSYEDIVFVGKSIGTAACLAFRANKNIRARCILLTPLTLTFEHDPAKSIAFNGTADPWAATEDIKRLCAERAIELHIYDGADHSLETGDVENDIKILNSVINKIDKYLSE